MTEQTQARAHATESGARQTATMIVRYGAMVFGVVVLVQFYLAGSGIFAATGPVKQAASLDPHRMLGDILAVLALLLLVGAIVARPGRRVLTTVIVLFVLTGIEGLVAIIGTSTPAVGGLHPVIAAVIFALTALIPLWLPRR